VIELREIAAEVSAALVSALVQPRLQALTTLDRELAAAARVEVSADGSRQRA
jgi:hypothetical protein